MLALLHHLLQLREALLDVVAHHVEAVHDEAEPFYMKLWWPCMAQATSV
jgi:hypothetical protein